MTYFIEARSENHFTYKVVNSKVTNNTGKDITIYSSTIVNGQVAEKSFALKKNASIDNFQGSISSIWMNGKTYHAEAGGTTNAKSNVKIGTEDRLVGRTTTETVIKIES